MIKFCITTVCFCLLFSCDYVNNAIIKNSSFNSKKIKVVPQIGSKYVDTDFLKYTVKKFDFDSVDNSYIFILDTGKEVTIQHRFNSQLNLEQKVIVNDYDTIDLHNDKRIKKSTFGGSSLYITLQ
jgi:hypothetical protein